MNGSAGGYVVFPEGKARRVMRAVDHVADGNVVVDRPAVCRDLLVPMIQADVVIGQVRDTIKLMAAQVVDDDLLKVDFIAALDEMQGAQWAVKDALYSIREVAGKLANSSGRVG